MSRALWVPLGRQGQISFYSPQRKPTIKDNLWLASAISNFLLWSKFLRIPWGEKIEKLGQKGENDSAVYVISLPNARGSKS